MPAHNGSVYVCAVKSLKVDLTLILSLPYLLRPYSFSVSKICDKCRYSISVFDRRS